MSLDFRINPIRKCDGSEDMNILKSHFLNVNIISAQY